MSTCISSPKLVSVILDKEVTTNYLKNKKQSDFLLSFGLEPKTAADEQKRLSCSTLEKPSLLHQHMYSLHGLLRPKGVYNQLDIPLCSDLNNEIIEHHTRRPNRPFSAPILPKFTIRASNTRPINNINVALRLQQIINLRRSRLLRNSIVYCFNGCQRRERFHILCTGLNKNSRRLSRLVKPCSVRLEPLTNKVASRYLVHSSRHVCLQRLSKKRLQRARSMAAPKSEKLVQSTTKAKKTNSAPVKKPFLKTKSSVSRKIISQNSKAGLPLSGQKFVRVCISPISRAKADYKMARVTIERLILSNYNASRKLEFGYVTPESMRSSSRQSTPSNSSDKSDFRRVRPTSRSPSTPEHFEIHSSFVPSIGKSPPISFTSFRSKLRKNSSCSTTLDDEEVTISPLILTPKKTDFLSMDKMITPRTDLIKSFESLSVDPCLYDSLNSKFSQDEEVSVSPRIIFPVDVELPVTHMVDKLSHAASSPDTDSVSDFTGSRYSSDSNIPPCGSSLHSTGLSIKLRRTPFNELPLKCSSHSNQSKTIEKDKFSSFSDHQFHKK